jgi:hypothetical protein
MVFERLRKIVDAKLAKLGLKINYKLCGTKHDSVTEEIRNTIHLNPKDSKSSALAAQNMQHLLLHEIGHILVRTKIPVKIKRNQKVMALFGDLIKRYRRRQGRIQASPDFISNYAQVQPRDDFCETFAVYANLNGDIRKIRAFLKKGGKGPKVLKKMLWISRIVKNIANI